MTGASSSGLSQIPDSTSRKGKQLRVDLSKDLALLRQARHHGVSVFLRGSPVLEEVANELEQYNGEQFAGVTKKAVRDSLNLLLDQHRRKEDWAS